MPSRVRVGLGFAAGVSGISLAALFVRWALPAPPVVTAFYRVVLATAVLVLWRGIAPGAARAPLPRGRALAAALAAGACFAGDLALWHTALVRTSVANATFLVNTTPIHVGLISWLVLGERPDARFVGGAALALGGAALLLRTDLSRGTADGDLLALAGGLFYSGYLLLIAAVRRGTDALPALLVACAGAGAGLAVCVLVRGDPLAGFPAASWLAFAGAALVSQLGGVLGIVWSLRFLRTSFASVALLAQPVGTALLGWALLGEGLSAWQSVGGAAVLAGIAVAARRGAAPPLPSPEPG